ncbi:hypothetical protein [Desulfitobacterium sp.]|uniref:hypothetical protein n=1 Tax=Desulfitobacterium sp. TaxID=49981 RepID=UPI002B219044|nr:hypothetical protein [Desulfitobacterium sp.]MEA4902422.1 hypothetical protein [Desulfitobacterium sp.]
MSSGIFGPRAPSYPRPTYYNQNLRRSYGSYPPPSSVPSPASYPAPASYPTTASYRVPASYSYTAPYHAASVPQAYSGRPYPNMPAPVVYPENLPPYSPVYLPVMQYSRSCSEHGLEAVLIAILVLVSLDLIFVRPLKKLPE